MTPQVVYFVCKDVGLTKRGVQPLSFLLKEAILMKWKETVKGLKVNGVDAEVTNVLNETYKISRPFLMLTNSQEESHVKSFLEFVMSEEGQEIVSENQIPVK